MKVTSPGTDCYMVSDVIKKTVNCWDDQSYPSQFTVTRSRFERQMGLNPQIELSLLKSVRWTHVRTGPICAHMMLVRSRAMINIRISHWQIWNFGEKMLVPDISIKNELSSTSQNRLQIISSPILVTNIAKRWKIYAKLSCRCKKITTVSKPL